MPSYKLNAETAKTLLEFHSQVQICDESGNVIGVVVAKLGWKAAAATGDLPQNVGYAVKSAYALPLLEPYLDGNALAPNQAGKKPRFEDMVAKAQESVVLIIVD